MGLEGTRLEVEDTGSGVLLKRATAILDMIGTGVGNASVKEMKRLLDEMRVEGQ